MREHDSLYGVFIQREASALLVQLYRVLRRPQIVGQQPIQVLRFFVDFNAKEETRWQ